MHVIAEIYTFYVNGFDTPRLLSVVILEGAISFFPLFCLVQYLVVLATISSFNIYTTPLPVII